MFTVNLICYFEILSKLKCKEYFDFLLAFLEYFYTKFIYRNCLTCTKLYKIFILISYFL